MGSLARAALGSTTVMSNADPTPKPWGRQRGESRQALAAFVAYRDMGSSNRSLAKVGRKLGKSVASLERWSARWSWVTRATTWDALMDRKKRRRAARVTLEMAERQAVACVMVQQRAIERLQGLDPTALTPGAVLRYLIEAVRLERVCRGLPDTAGFAEAG